MASTNNYGFIMPDPTDFVTDLPADFEIFGDEVDLRVKALNPETTEGDLAYRGATADAKDRLAIGTAGQVLAVNTGATAPEWVTPATLPITTEGDLIVGDATGVPIRLPVGAAGEVLTSDGDTVSFVAPAGGGKVLQVVSATTTTSASITTTSFVDTNLTATITPSATNSKVLVLVSQHFFWNRNGTECIVQYQMLRDAVQVYNLSSSQMFQNFVAAATQIQGRNNVAISLLDSPATTSATTYKTQAKIAGASTSTFNNGSTSSIVLLEIGA